MGYKYISRLSLHGNAQWKNIARGENGLLIGVAIAVPIRKDIYIPVLRGDVRPTLLIEGKRGRAGQVGKPNQ
jgi:hypothetical protein